MLSEYRQRFDEFHEEIHRDNYQFRSGRASESERNSILSGQSDLFTPTRLEELRGALKEIASHRESERSSLRRLISFVIAGNLTLSVQELNVEIARYEKSARIDWQGAAASIGQALGLLAEQSSATVRRDLFARTIDAIRTIDDLRAERFARIKETVVHLGFAHYPGLVLEQSGLDLGRLTVDTEKLLSNTESLYQNALAQLVGQETGVRLDEATEADAPRLLRFPRFDHFFPADQMARCYRELFAAFGFKTERQSNLRLDAVERPHKQAHAFCAPIEVPTEIMLSYSQRGGQANYRELLREAGRAQHYAWTSGQLYPEFRTGGAFDFLNSHGASRLAWGMLLENLFLDESWVMSNFGFVESGRFRHALGVFRLMTTRRLAATLRYEIEFYGEGAMLNPAGRYAELASDAVRIGAGEIAGLIETALPFHSADALRASAFESQMREYLKTKFGQRWWASAKAGETLIDLWNTGERYSLEELASMIGLGELDFQWLASELQTQVRDSA